MEQGLKCPCSPGTKTQILTQVWEARLELWAPGLACVPPQGLGMIRPNPSSPIPSPLPVHPLVSPDSTLDSSPELATDVSTLQLYSEDPWKVRTQSRPALAG
jgi:hypothetical protein